MAIVDKDLRATLESLRELQSPPVPVLNADLLVEQYHIEDQRLKDKARQRLRAQLLGMAVIAGCPAICGLAGYLFSVSK